MGTIRDKLQKALASKDAIKAALIAKGVENVDDVMSHYAGFIEAIQTGGGSDLDFTEIGYEGTPQYLIDGLVYAETIKEWRDFGDDEKLIFFPYLGDLTINKGSFQNCVNLIQIPNATYKVNSGAFLANCPRLTELHSTFDLSDNTNSYAFFNGCYGLCIVDCVILGKQKILPTFFNDCRNLTNITIKDIGKEPTASNYDFSGAKNWGNEKLRKGAKQTLIDSLITYSFDRAKAGYDPLTIRLAYELREKYLTKEEKEQITAKGYTIA